MNQYHYYWYETPIINTLIIITTLQQRFINDIIHLIIKLSHLNHIRSRKVTYPTILATLYVRFIARITIYHPYKSQVEEFTP